MDRTEKLNTEARFASGIESVVEALKGKGPIFHMVSLNQTPEAWVAMYGSIEDDGYHLAIVLNGQVVDDKGPMRDGKEAFRKLSQMGNVAYLADEAIEQFLRKMPKMDPETKTMRDLLMRAMGETPAAEA